MIVNGHPTWQSQPVAQGWDGGDNGGMESRIVKLEEFAQDARERLVKIDTRLDHIEKTMATMATKDGMAAAISEAKNSIIMWVVSAILLAQVLPSLLKKFGL